jgi:hypothetical protein
MEKPLGEEQLDDVSGGGRNSDSMQIAVNKADKDQDAARDRRKGGLDNIQKFLDIIHGINPSI